MITIRVAYINRVAFIVVFPEECARPQNIYCGELSTDNSIIHIRSDICGYSFDQPERIFDNDDDENSSYLIRFDNQRDFECLTPVISTLRKIK